MSNIVLYNLCLIEKPNGEILVQKRLRGLEGHTFPGGKVNIDESIKASVIREVYEETGLLIKKPIYKTMVSFYDSEAKERRQIFLFKATDFCGELVSQNEEGINFWCSVENFLNLHHVDGMQEFLQAYNDCKLEWHYSF